ncbi:hypothetical protein JMUB7516_27000 [Staphylococcus aureus]
MKERYGTVYKGSQRLIDEESGEVIEVDKLYRCLLYTSPSPRDYAASRMPSSA